MKDFTKKELEMRLNIAGVMLIALLCLTAFFGYNYSIRDCERTVAFEWCEENNISVCCDSTMNWCLLEFHKRLDGEIN